MTWQEAGQVLWPPGELAPLPQRLMSGGAWTSTCCGALWVAGCAGGRPRWSSWGLRRGWEVSRVLAGGGCDGGGGEWALIRWRRASGVDWDAARARLGALGDGAEQVWGVVGDAALTAGQVGPLVGRPEREMVGLLEALEHAGLLTRWYAVSLDTVPGYSRLLEYWLRTLDDSEQDQVLRGLGLPAHRVPVSELWRSRLIGLQMQDRSPLFAGSE